MNDYEAKQEAKRARLERAADNATAEASRRFDAAREAVAGIPFGQPILVDHHSAPRHRAALRRQDTNMRKGSEAIDAARELTRRAEAVGTGGISIDDPDAVAKLDDKRTDLERERDHMKSANAFYKKHKTLTGWDGPEEMLREGTRTIEMRYPAPFPAFSLTNIGARIRSAAKRSVQVAKLHEVASTAEATIETIEGVEITTDPAELRVLVRFPARLSKDDYKTVRRHGFVWSPTRTAFVRQYRGPGTVEQARILARNLAKPGV